MEGEEGGDGVIGWTGIGWDEVMEYRTERGRALFVFAPLQKSGVSVLTS